MKIHCVRKKQTLQVWFEDEWNNNLSLRTTIDFSDPESAIQDVQCLLDDLSYEYLDGVGSIDQRERRFVDVLDLSIEAVEDSISELENLISKLKELTPNDSDRQESWKRGAVHPSESAGSGGRSVRA